MYTKRLLNKGISTLKTNKIFKAFTLTEMLISMAVISLLMAATVPLITQFSTLKTGVDKNVMKCITANSSSGWFTDATGDTTVPTTEPCKTAVTETLHGNKTSVNTATWMAAQGSSAQKLMAKKILRAACDQGGEKACDYFINACQINGSSSSPYCDDTATFSDITYYLHQNATANTNYGATYIYNSLGTALIKAPSILISEVFRDCANNQSPDSNQNLSVNLSCQLSKPKLYIQACNDGNTAACILSYNNNYNKSCKQVKTTWANAPNGDYRLTYNNSGAYDTVNCNMTSLAAASITGCNGSTANLLGNATEDDCSYGWTNNYNRSCSQVFNAWHDAPTSTYKLTSSGAPPTSPVSTSCTVPAIDACIAGGAGTLCADGTVYAGDYAGYHYYTTPANEAGTYTWNNGNGYDTSASFYTNTGATSLTDGAANTALLLTLSDKNSPYAAAVYIRDLNTANYLGHNDWFLPAVNEAVATYSANSAALGYSIYEQSWSSTEIDLVNARAFVAAGPVTAPKDTPLYARAVRKSAVQDASCTTIGNTCTDTSKYIGTYLGKYYYGSPTARVYVTWNNGKGYVPGNGFVITGANNPNYGMINYNILANATDTGSPYKAEGACKARNTANYLGHNDWYLPAINEVLSVLIPNRNTGALNGTFPLTWYWSSTEWNYYQSPIIAIDSASYAYPESKNSTYYSPKVRCLRRSN